MDSLQSLAQSATPAVTAGDVLRILWRRSWVIVLILGASLGISYFVSIRTPKRYKATMQLMLIQRQATLITSAQGANTAPIVENVETQLAMLSGIYVAHQALAVLKNTALDRGEKTSQYDIDAETFRKFITASVAKDTNLVEVSVEGASPAEASERASAVCKAFIDWKKLISGSNSAVALDNLSRGTEKARQEMLKAEREETQFKQNHRMADVNTQQSASLQQFLQRDADAKTAEQEVIASRAKVNALAARLKDANQAIQSGTGVRDDQLVLSLQQQLNTAEQDRAAAALKYTPEFPGILPDLDAKIIDIKGRLQQAIHNTLDNKKPSLQAQGTLFEEYKQAQTTLIFNETKLKAMSTLRDQLHAETSTIPQTSMEFARLSRTTEMARQLYSQNQAALNAARIEKDLTSSSANVLPITPTPLVPNDPFLPNRARDLSFGGAIGLFLSMIAVLLLEQGDTRMRSIESVRKLGAGPVIGALPPMSRRRLQRGNYVDEEPLALEAFSLARANLSLVHKQSAGSMLWNKQIIMVTSAVMGEGKSFTAHNMARSIARAGRSVVLVDADMRRPAQNRLFRTDEPYGLSDVLSGKMSIDETLFATDVPGLLVMHSGIPDRNPTELVSRPVMHETLELLRAECDVVVVDTPACSAVADSLLIAPHADCILYVVGAGQVDQDLVNETTAALRSASPKSMAFFVNRAPRERKTSYSGYYYYAARGVPNAYAADSTNIVTTVADPARNGDQHDVVTEPPPDSEREITLTLQRPESKPGTKGVASALLSKNGDRRKS